MFIALYIIFSLAMGFIASIVMLRYGEGDNDDMMFAGIMATMFWPIAIAVAIPGFALYYLFVRLPRKLEYDRKRKSESVRRG